MRELSKGKFVFASHNEGKLREFKNLMKPFHTDIACIAEWGYPEPEEVGTTFEENASIKAISAASQTNYPSLADDSGLCVDILGGKPGIHSAAQACREDGTRDFCYAMEKIQQALEKVGAFLPEQRTAHFVSVLCLAFPDGETDFFRGEITGTLVWPPRGNLGFGYDSIFLPNGYDLTFGEMKEEQKHGWKPKENKALSHRARSFEKFARKYFARSCLFSEQKNQDNSHSIRG